MKNTPQSLKARYFAIAVATASMVSIGLHAASPRLAVGILVDGLSGEYVDLLKEHLGQEGLNRFLNNGIVLENVDYGTPLDATAVATVLMTGASPSANGISGQFRYDVQGRRNIPVFHDDRAMGNYTSQTYSPRAILSSTLTDEARVAGAGVTYAHSIAASPAIAIALAGHAANSAVWLDDTSGNWATSTFYPDLPTAVANRNRFTPLSSRLDTMQWTPSAISANADFIPEHLRKYPFRYTFQRGNQNRFDAYARSPLANAEITAMAAEYIQSLALGTHNGTDFLTIGLNLQPYEYTKTGENRYELIDAYVKLDSQLASLMSTIDKTVGSDNTLYFLAATPPRTTRRRDDPKWNIPGGEFSTRKAISLLNLYLIAIHGNGEWVSAYNDHSFYLNHDLANAKNVDMTTLRAQAADFLKRMSGVVQAHTIDEILTGRAATDNAEALRRNTVVANTGDIIVEVQPGWVIVDDASTAASGHNTDIKATASAPVYLLIPGTRHTVITTPADARSIAPTVAGQLHIRPPNASSMPALRF